MLHNSTVSSCNRSHTRQCLIVHHSVDSNEGIVLIGHITLQCIASCHGHICDVVSATIANIIGVDDVGIEAFSAAARTGSQTIDPSCNALLDVFLIACLPATVTFDRPAALTLIGFISRQVEYESTSALHTDQLEQVTIRSESSLKQGMTSHVVKYQIQERAARLRATRQDLKQGVLRTVFACHLREAAACSRRDIKRQASLIQVVAFRGAVKESRVENAWVYFSRFCSGAVTAATSVEMGLISGCFTMPQMAIPVFARSVRHSTRAVRVLLGASQGVCLASAVADLQTHVGGHTVQDVAVHIDNRSRQPGAVFK